MAAEQYWPLIQKYFPLEAQARAYAIMQRESGGDPRAANDQVPARERSYGLFQINTNVHGLTPQQAMDPDTNVRYAAQLYQQQGWQPWVTTYELQNGLAAGSTAAGTAPAGGGQMAETENPIIAETAGGSGDSKIQPVRVEWEDGSIRWMDKNTGQFLWLERPYSIENDPRVKSPDKPKTQILKRRDGSSVVVNSDTGEEIRVIEDPTKGPADGEPPATQKFPDGSLRQYNATSGTWDVIGEAPPPEQSAPETKTFPDGSLREYNPKTGQWRMIQSASEKTGYDTEAARLDVLKGQQDLMSPNALGLQQHLDFIDEVQKGIAQGRYTQDQADKMIAQDEALMSAKLQGTTPWAMQQAKEQKTAQDRAYATDILNQRSQATTGMANSLLNSALGANILMPKGQTSLGFDPWAAAKSMVGQSSQDADLVPYAKQLLSSVMSNGGG